MNTPQSKQQEKMQEDPHKGVNVGMATGKLFESQMLGDLSSKLVLESFQQTLNEALQNSGIGEKDLNEAVKHILFRGGVNQGKRKWRSLADFMQSAFGSIKSGTEEDKAEAYYDFNELLRVLNAKDKFPHIKKSVPTFLSRDTDLNISLEIARKSQSEINSKKFVTVLSNELKQKLAPGVRLQVISGLGTPMDYVQKIDFVVAILDAKGKIVRYYSYDLKTDPNKKESIMKDVVVVMPEDLQATLDERTRSCLDIVVQNVVERESKVTLERRN